MRCRQSERACRLASQACLNWPYGLMVSGRSPRPGRLRSTRPRQVPTRRSNTGVVAGTPFCHRLVHRHAGCVLAPQEVDDDPGLRGLQHAAEMGASVAACKVASRPTTLRTLRDVPTTRQRPGCAWKRSANRKPIQEVIPRTRTDLMSSAQASNVESTCSRIDWRICSTVSHSVLLPDGSGSRWVPAWRASSR